MIGVELGVSSVSLPIRRRGLGGGGGGAADPHWPNVVLQSHFTGDDGSTTFTDESNSGHTLTPNGGVQIQSNRAVFGGSSDLIWAADSADWEVVADYTWELFKVAYSPVSSGRRGLFGQWVYPNDLLQRAHALEFRGDATPDDLFFATSQDGTTGDLVFSDAFTPVEGQEYDIFVSINSGVARIFIDGVMRGKGNVGVPFATSGRRFHIGAGTNPATQAHTGTMGAARLTKGVGRYGTDDNQTVPSLPLPTG